MIETIKDANEVWKAANNMYSGVGNVILMAQVEKELMKIRQEQHTVLI